MEHKSDTMFDIVQNMAKEISAMKMEQHMRAQFPNSSSGIYTMPYPPMHMGGGGAFRFAEQEYDDNDNLESSAVEELENNEDVEDSDEDDDDDEEEDSDDSDDDDDMMMCPIEEDDMECEAFTKIKVSEEEDEIQVTEDELLDSSIPEVEPTQESAAAIVSPEELLPTESTAQSTGEDEYKKLSLGDLKKLAATKGIQKDVHKLKRQELIKLLQQQP